jgi:hypothetical protein
MRLLVFLVLLVSCSITPVHPAAHHAYVTTGCPRVRVERVDRIIRSNGKVWVVVRLNACGEKMVFEKHGTTWRDITWRMR